MTEAEARSKWCPFSRSIYFVNAPSVAGTFVAANRGNDGKLSARNCCLGNACMAWTGKNCLLCGICQKSNLLQFATVDLESELIELPAPTTTSSGDLKAVSSQRHRRLPSFPAVAADGCTALSRRALQIS